MYIYIYIYINKQAVQTFAASSCVTSDLTQFQYTKNRGNAHRIFPFWNEPSETKVAEEYYWRMTHTTGRSCWGRSDLDVELRCIHIHSWPYVYSVPNWSRHSQVRKSESVCIQTTCLSALTVGLPVS